MNKNTTTTTKTITQSEYLSAFLDDESGTFEQRRMLDETQKDIELKKKIANYSLIGEAMRNEKSAVTVQPSFLAGIHEKLEEEPTYQEVQIQDVRESSKPSWFNPVAGMAIAASLAAITVVALNVNNGMNSSTNANSSTVVANNDTSPKLVTAAASVEANDSESTQAIVALSDPDMVWRKRLKNYVNSHVKYASTSAIMPSIRAASYVSNH